MVMNEAPPFKLHITRFSFPPLPIFFPLRYSFKDFKWIYIVIAPRVMTLYLAVD